MSNTYEIALQTGANVTRSVEAYFRKVKKENPENHCSPERKKTLSDGSTIFMWSKKWNPYRYDFDMGLLGTLERNNESNDANHAYMLVAVSDQDCSEMYYNEPGTEYFNELCAGVCYPEEWYEDRTGKIYDAVLMEKPSAEGLGKKEVMRLFNLLKSETGMPLEFKDPEGNTAVFGFISPKAVDKLGPKLDGFENHIWKILADPDREEPACRYKGLRIWLSMR